MKFEVEGYNIDNLLKTLYFRKITLYNVNRIKINKVSFEVRDKQAKKVKRHIANFKVKQTLSKVKQLPKFILANVGVLLGVFIGLIFSIFASNYTWQIQVYGTEVLSVDELKNILKDNGVSVGKINIKTSEEIEEILLSKCERIAQVSVIKEGTAIIINLSEKLVYDKTEYLPIIAKENGIIKSINVVTGTINTKVGDYVNKGDVLVLPFNINANGEKISVMPLAEIIAEMYIVSICELQKEEQVLTRTGKTQLVYEYKIFNKKIFSGKNKNSFAIFESVVYNENVSSLIPLTRDVFTFYELEMTTLTHNFQNEQEGLKEKSKLLAYEKDVVGELLSEKTDVSISENKMTACTILTILGNINDTNFG